jgi:hypothetical protein
VPNCQLLKLILELFSVLVREDEPKFNVAFVDPLSCAIDILPLAFKFSPTPTPPATTNAPVVVLVEEVVLVKEMSSEVYAPL